MAICRRCGAELGARARFCRSCGLEAPAQDGYHRQNDNYGQYSGDGRASYGDTSDAFDPRDIEDNRTISILCYLGPLLLIPLLTRPYSPLVKFHANQGLILLIFSILSSAVHMIPFIGGLVASVCGIFSLVCIVLGIVNAVNGKAVPLPIIGVFTILR